MDENLTFSAIAKKIDTSITLDVRHVCPYDEER
jgi:hypothetical protein